MLTMRVFTGLTLLDTIQGTVGRDLADPRCGDPARRGRVHEHRVHGVGPREVVLLHLLDAVQHTTEIDEAFRWSAENEYLQKKARSHLSATTEGDDPHKRKVASVMLESFLFYSGFYLPMYWSSRAKLTNTADLIRLIIRDEAVHGYYIGYKFQGARRGDARAQDELKDFTFDLL